MDQTHTPSDNPKLDALLAAYLEAVERGEKPDREQLKRDNPDLAADLQACFEDLDRVFVAARKPTEKESASTLIGPGEPTSGVLIGGRYKLIENIGEGGMGSVWVAEQQRPLKRKVAIKLIKPGMDSKQVLARFEAERQALAVMDHPNIAKVFDGGMTDQGRPFFVMEYVKGVPFTEYCDRARLSLRERLTLFIPVCSAVQHAHQKGIVHRDLKPSNIMVCLYDGRPVPKVIDFGLAKAMHQPLTDQSIHTGHGVMVGTPLYMSPEQAESNNLDVDTRTDIYSLGVVLYELLTGTTPIERHQMKQAAMNEMLRLIKDFEPPRPSLRLSGSDSLPSIAAQRNIEPKRLSRSVSGDLDWIVMKSLDKERSRRYDSANGLARDIERFLNEEAVEACPPSNMYRLKKLLWKHRGKAVVAAIVLLTLIGGIVGTSWGLIRAKLAESKSKVSEDKAVSALQQVTKERDAKIKAEVAVVQAEVAIVKERADKERAELRVREAASSEYVGLTGKLFREELVRSSGWAERSWDFLKSATALQTPLRSDSEIRSAAAAVLIADEYRSEPDWILPSGVRLKSSVSTATYSPSDNLGVIAPNFDYLRLEPQILLLDATTGVVKQTLTGADNKPLSEMLQKGNISSLRSKFVNCQFLGSDRELLAGTRWGRLYHWDLSKSPPTEKVVNVGSSWTVVYLTPDNKWCVTRCTGSKQLRCWDAHTLQLVGGPIDFEMQKEGVSMVDNESILVHTDTGTSLVSLPELAVIRAVDSQAWRVFHPSGQFFLSGDGQSLHAMNWPEMSRAHTYLNPEMDSRSRTDVASNAESVAHYAYSRSGQVFATAVATERGQEIRMWDAWGGEPRWRIAVPTGSTLDWDGRALSDNASRLMMISKEDVRQLSRIRSTLATYRAPGHPSGVRYVQTAPDAGKIAVLGERRKDGDDSCVIWKTGDTPHALHSRIQGQLNSIPPNAIDALSYSPDGKWLATVGYNQPKGIGIVLSDCTKPNAGHAIFVPHEERGIGNPTFNAGAVAGFGWSARGELVAAIEYELFAWNVNTVPPSLSGRTSSFTIGGRIPSYASMAMNGTDVGWAVTIRSELRKFRLGSDRVEITNHVQVPGEGNTRICRINPSNSQLAIGKADGTVVLYDTAKETFGPLMTEGHSDSVQAMLWLNEHRLITGSRDGWFSIWDVSDAGQLSLWYKLQLKAPVSDIAPTADKQAVYVACSDETSLRVYDLAVIDRELKELFSESKPVAPSDSESNRSQPDLASRDEEIIDRVVFGAGQDKSTEPVINWATEKEVAEWVTSLGGTVTIANRNGEEIPHEAGELPQQKYLVRDIRIDGAAKVTNAELAKLRGCRALTTLELVNLPQLTDEAFTTLEGIGLRELTIEQCPALTDNATISIAKLSRLESLRLGAGSLTDACLPQLGPLKKLSQVTIAEPGITNAGLAKLAEACPRLTTLDIASSPHPGLTAIAMASFGELREVRLSGPQLTDAAIPALNSLPELTTLSLNHSISDETVRRLGQLTGITKLSIQSDTLDDRTVLSRSIYSQVTWPHSLSHLILVGSKVAPGDDDLFAFSQLPQLHGLELNCRQSVPRYTPLGLARFRRQRPTATLIDLGEPTEAATVDYAAERAAAEWVLSVGGTLGLKDTEGNTLPFADGKLPDTSFLVDACGFSSKVHHFNNADLSKLVACRKLNALHIMHLAELTDEGVFNLRGIGVRELQVLYCPLLTDNSLVSIGRFYDVKSFYAQGVAFTDAGIAALKPLDTLREIGVSTTAITDAGLIRLAEACPEITWLDMTKSPNGQQTIRGVSRFHRLTNLIINGNQFTDEAVDIVNSIPTLGTLTIDYPIDNTIIARLPRLNSVFTLQLRSNGNETAAQMSPSFLSDIQWPASLQMLYLSGGAVSPRDEDLVKLAQHANLKGITVGDTNDSSHPPRWTYAGFLKLRKLRPDIWIMIDRLHYASGQPLPPSPP